MTEAYTNLICREAIKTYGEKHQMLIAIEEMSELTKELIKYHRGYDVTKNIIEEVADVKLMLLQLEMIFGKHSIELAMKKKIDRLDERMNDEHANIKA